MTNSDPLISVVIPAHNAQTTIDRALRSVAAQTFTDYEVIVVDDASVDQTAVLAGAFPDLTIKLERTGRQSGASEARNIGIRAACGEFVAFLDADDEWLPEKLARQIAIIRDDPDMVFISCNAEIMLADGRSEGLINLGRKVDPGTDAWKSLMSYTCVPTPCVIARRDALLEIGGFNPELPIAEDQDLWIRLALDGKVGLLDETLVRVHDTANSLSKTERVSSLKYTLPMVLGHVERNGDRMSRQDRRNILGHRFTWVGRNCYSGGEYRRGVSLLLNAVAKGHHPIENLQYLISASPLVRFVKRLTRYENPHGDVLRPAILDQGQPLLLVIIDTEEEFDWTKPFSKHNRSVESIKAQPLAQKIMDRYGIRPTYVVDYPVADDDDAADVMRSIFQDGRCDIGAHLQPWVNPPYEEPETIRNSYPGNLPFSLEYRKLAALTRRIEEQFQTRPVVYKAGRYGVGPSTEKILQSLGYSIDASVLPHTNLIAEEGPNFEGLPDQPYWFGERLELLEVSLTRGFHGKLAPWGGEIFSVIGRPWGQKAHLPGMFSRLGLLERITLTPEGISYKELVRLTRSLLRQERKIFCFTYHSSTLLPGANTYVRDRQDLDAFLETMDRYFEFFMTEIGGRPSTLLELRSQIRNGDVDNKQKDRVRQAAN